MIVCVRDMRYKEVINLTDGTMLGTVDDVELDTASAKVLSVVIYGKPRFFGLLGRDEDLVVKWEDIGVIGEDTILVNLAQDRPRRVKKEGFFERLTGR